MKVEFLRKFNSDVKKIKDKKIKNEIIAIIEGLEAANKITDIKNLKKMKTYKNAYRLSFDSYRIGIFIENDTIEIARVLHRKDIYRYFP